MDIIDIEDMYTCPGYWYHGICRWLIPESPNYEIKYP
jgi:hypothetical protein